MEDPNIPPILQSIKPHQWSLGNQLAKYQKQSLGPAKYMDFAKQGISFDEVFKQEHDQIVQDEILKNVLPIAEESVKAGVSDEEFEAQLYGTSPGITRDAQGRTPSLGSNPEPLNAEMGGDNPLMYTSEGKDPVSAFDEADEYIQRFKDADAQYQKEVGKAPKVPGRAPIQKPDTVEALVTLAAMFANPGKFSGDIAKSLFDAKLGKQQEDTQLALRDFAIADEQHKQALAALKDRVENSMSMYKQYKADKLAGDKAVETARHNRVTEATSAATAARLQEAQDNKIPTYVTDAIRKLSDPNVDVKDKPGLLVVINEDRASRGLNPYTVKDFNLDKSYKQIGAEATTKGVEARTENTEVRTQGLIAKNEFDKKAFPIKLEILMNQKLHGDAQELFDANKQILDDLAIQKNRIELKYLGPKLQSQLNSAAVTRKAAQQRMDNVTKELAGGKPLSRDGYQQAKTKWQQQITEGKVLLLDKDPKTMAESHAIGKMYIEEAQRNIADLDGQMKKPDGTAPVNPFQGLKVPGFEFLDPTKGK